MEPYIQVLGAVGDTFCGTSFFLGVLTLVKILKVWVLLTTHFAAPCFLDFWSFDFGKDFEGVGAAGDTFCGVRVRGFVISHYANTGVVVTWVTFYNQFI